MEREVKQGDIYDPSPHLVAFIDGLGFSKKIENLEFAKRYFKAIDQAHEFLKRKYSHHEKIVKMTTIGDSIVLALEVPEMFDGVEQTLRADFLNKLAHLCETVALMQGALAYQDFWTRGAITYGSLHFSGNMIVGTAFNRSYFLEKNVARYPRVILDGGVVKASGYSTCDELR